MNLKYAIAIDFDGTIAENAYPGIGKLIPGAKENINRLYQEGAAILINTCRTGSYEGDVENYLRRHGIKYHYINCNMPERIEFFNSDCRKLSADIYIDDKCIGGLPTWDEIYERLSPMVQNRNQYLIQTEEQKLKVIENG